MGVEDKDRRLRPGPGQYGADGNVNGMSASVRGAVAIPKSKRETQFESASKSQAFVPGPGNYSAANRSNAPAVTFGAKQPTKYNANPGPGQYNNEKSRPASGRVALGMASRPDLWKVGADDTAHKPGPGNYQEKGAFNQGKAASFGGKYKPEKNNNPGPG